MLRGVTEQDTTSQITALEDVIPAVLAIDYPLDNANVGRSRGLELEPRAATNACRSPSSPIRLFTGCGKSDDMPCDQSIATPRLSRPTGVRGFQGSTHTWLERMKNSTTPIMDLKFDSLSREWESHPPSRRSQSVGHNPHCRATSCLTTTCPDCANVRRSTFTGHQEVHASAR